MKALPKVDESNSYSQWQ